MVGQETIARLTGLLTFNVDTSGLLRFTNSMESARRKMLQLSQEATKLEKKLNLKLGIKTNSADRDKLDKQVRASLDRESKAEVLLQRARRATMTADLASQKLTMANTKQQAYIVSQSLRDQQQQAVLDSKRQKAKADQLKASGIVAKNENALAAAKTRQARLETVLGQAQQRTVILQNKQLQSMTSMQRAEVALQQVRERGQRAVERHASVSTAAKLRDQRQTEKHQQQAERFQWQQARQQVWQANQNRPKPVESGMSGVGMLAGFGALGAGLWAATAAVQKVAEHLGQVQTRVSDNQQFSNIIEQSAGKNPANKKFAKDEFLRISERYGTEVSNEAAKGYRTFLLAQMSRGKSISDATKMFETQQSAFRGTGMNQEEQRRAALQLQQVRSKGKSDGEDLNTLSEAAPLLVDPIRRAWAERNKHKLDDKLEKDFRASTKKGNLLAVDFDRGLEIFNRDNAPAIAKQSASIDANATRLSNKQFLQQQDIDSNPELIASVNNRIQAETELTEAMKPLKEATAQLDTAFMNMAASFLRFTMGKDESPADAGKKIDLLTPDMPAIDPRALSDTLPNTGEKVEDPVSSFWRKVLSLDVEGPASNLKVPEKDMFGLKSVSLKLDGLLKTMDAGDVADGEYRRFRPDAFEVFDASTAMKRASSQSEVTYPVPKRSSDAASNSVGITTNNVTAPVTVNITAKIDASVEDIAKEAKVVFDEQFAKTMSRTNTELGTETD
jgi:tape measure domain-containing protein